MTLDLVKKLPNRISFFFPFLVKKLIRIKILKEPVMIFLRRKEERKRKIVLIAIGNIVLPRVFLSEIESSVHE